MNEEDSKFDLHIWYKTFEKFTMETEFLDLSKEAVEALISTYKVRYCGKRGTGVEARNTQPLLAKLALDINEAMQRLGSTSPQQSNFFVRLSSRSPKDASYFDRCMFDREKGKGKGEMRALWVTLFSGLKVCNGIEAVELLIRSERVYTDLLAFSSTACSDYTNGLIIRSWNPLINPEWEFRTFIHQGRLTAISQYNEYIVVPELLDRRQEIQERIVKYWETVKESISMMTDQSFVLDLAISPTPQDGIIIIELNPFSESTGAALFNWKKDWDILTGNELHIRILEKEPENAKVMVDVLLDQYACYHGKPLSVPDSQ